MTKKLIIAPHVDDDVLGCGGIIDDNTFVLYCGLNESDLIDRPSMRVRLDEADKAAAYLGHEYLLLENKVNNYIIFSDKAIYKRNEEIVFTEGNSKAINENNTITASNFKFDMLKE